MCIQAIKSVGVKEYASELWTSIKEIDGGKILSSVSGLLEVNTNTAVKSYDLLASAGIIYNRRGLGYFVTKGAKDMILQERREQFMEEKLPELFRNMEMLGITIADISEAWDKRG